MFATFDSVDTARRSTSHRRAIPASFRGLAAILVLLAVWFPPTSAYLPAAQTGNDPAAVDPAAVEKAAVRPVPPTARWYKGNLHTHSLWSDGDNFPELIVAWYREHDYQFLALTEHNRIADVERWMSVKEIDRRSQQQAIPALREKFGDQWIELRGDAQAGTAEIRLRKLEEIRPRFEAPDEFLLIQAEEITDTVKRLPVHMNATNLQELILPAGGRTVREAIVNNLRAVREQSEKTKQPILLHLNHPNFGWGVTADDLAFASTERFFEVYNGHPGVRHLGDEKRPSVERMWDIVNTLRLKKYEGDILYGLGTDDSHNYYGTGDSRLGRGWIYVRTTELSPAALIQAMEAGDFYASSGVELSDLSYDKDNKTMHIKVLPQPGASYTIHLIATPADVSIEAQAVPDAQATAGQTSAAQASAAQANDKETSPRESTGLLRYSPEIGQIVKTIQGTSASFQCQDDWLFARIVVTSDQAASDPSFAGQTKQAWLQPFGWE